MGADSAGRILFSVSGVTYFSNSINSPGLPSITIFDGNCHHIAVKRTQNDLSFYIDSNLISSSVIIGAPSLSTNNFLRVGMNNNLNLSTALSGKIEYIRVWNYARKNVDIFNDIHLCISSSAGLIANWSFEQNPNNVILDSSPYLHHGLIIPQHANPVNPGPRFYPSLCHMDQCDFLVIKPASDPLCNPSSVLSYCSSNNLICNGDFEQENNQAGTFPNLAFDGCTAQGSSNEVVNWCLVAGTPGYYGRNTIHANYSIPTNFITQNFTPFCGGGIDTWNGTPANNDHYGVLAYTQGNADGIRTELISPLVPNATVSVPKIPTV